MYLYIEVLRHTGRKNTYMLNILLLLMFKGMLSKTGYHCPAMVEFLAGLVAHTTLEVEGLLRVRYQSGLHSELSSQDTE